MSGATGRKPRFDYAAYAERREKAWQRRMAGFEGLVIKARRGDPEPLINHFRYHVGPLQLSEDDCEMLSELLERKLPRKNGRPRGSVSHKAAAIACAGCLVRIGKAAWCRKHGRKRAPGPDKAPTKMLIERAIKLMEAHFSAARGKISAHAVWDQSNLKKDSETGAHVSEHLDDAIQEIIDLARK
jgi:hypothetical protein